MRKTHLSILTVQIIFRLVLILRWKIGRAENYDCIIMNEVADHNGVVLIYMKQAWWCPQNFRN